MSLKSFSRAGTLDAAFGIGGKVYTNMNNLVSVNQTGNAVVSQADGKLVVAGNNLIIRYNSNGSLDASFDTDGIVKVDIIPGGADVGTAIKLFSNKIYVAGHTITEGFYDFSLASLINDAFPLPLSLLTFNGRLISNNGLLNWKTTNENNTQSFNIERSIDGRTFSKVGSVAAFNISGDHQYNFTDKNINLLAVPVVITALNR